MSRKHGFTLVELMVVMAVVGMLMAMLLPALMKSRGMADMTRCASNLRQLGIAFDTYVSNQPDTGFPPATVNSARYGQKEWMDLIRPQMDLGTLDDGIQLLDVYQTSEWRKYKIFDCPGNDQNQSGSGRFDYGYNLNCVGRTRSTVRASNLVLLHCANHYAPSPVNGRTANPGIHEKGFDNFLFADGHVQSNNSYYKKAADVEPWTADY